ncbi:DgyrCDS8607 [Dimorphilus gyrociliatus]|uniref:DgyrCDS8607 n=1 Tax=Dimorphilus gyrociliatus TaxID=2664684 RepID=A0A7I8VZS6_9ANNE|nr:DgyrCDS8607 [Dimorphilus gyrociliatus]
MGSTLKYMDDGSLYVGDGDGMKILSDSDLEPTSDNTLEIIVHFESTILNTASYSYLKKDQNGYKITPSSGYTTIAIPTGSKDHFNANISKVEKHLSYLAVTIDYQSKIAHYYKNGVKYGQNVISGAVSSTPLLLGFCDGWCGTSDFQGKIYAFKWSNSYKTASHFENIWIDDGAKV